MLDTPVVTLLDFNLTHSGLGRAHITGQRVGYARVSTLDQNLERQLDGIHLDKTFADHASGKDAQRRQPGGLFSLVRDGDTVIVHSMDRLARNLDDLRAVVRVLTARGVQVKFVKEQLTFTGDDSPMATLLLSVMGAFAEFDRALIRERRREGIVLAKQRGAYRGRRRSLTSEQAALLTARAAAGVAKAELAREFGVSCETVYQYLRAGAGQAQPFVQADMIGEHRTRTGSDGIAATARSGIADRGDRSE